MKRKSIIIGVVAIALLCCAVFLFRNSPGIYYIVAEVEILRYVYFQVLDEVLL